MTDNDGKPDLVLAEKFDGKPFNAPNDVVVHPDGGIWFTDPSYGFLQGFKPEPRHGDYVWRFTYDMTQAGHLNTPEEVGTRLKILLGAGIQCFIDLTGPEELEPVVQPAVDRRRLLDADRLHGGYGVGTRDHQAPRRAAPARHS